MSLSRNFSSYLDAFHIESDADHILKLINTDFMINYRLKLSNEAI